MRFALYLVFVGFIHYTSAQGASSQSSFDFSMFSNGNNGATSNGLGSGLAATSNNNGLANSGAISQSNAQSTMLAANQNAMNTQGLTQGGLSQNVNQNQMMNTNQNQMMNTNQNQMMNTIQNQMMNTNQNQMMNPNQNQMNMNQNQMNMNSGMGMNQNNLMNGQTMNNGMGMNQNSIMNSQNMNMNSMNNMGMNNPQRNTMQNGVVIQNGAMMPNQFGMQQGMPNGMGQVMTNMNFQDPTQLGRFNGNNLNNLGFDNTQGGLFQNQLNAQNTPFFGQQFGQSSLLQTQGAFGQDPFGSSVLGSQIMPQFASTFPGQPGFGPFVDPMMNAFAPNPFLTSPMMSSTMLSSPMMSSPMMGSVMTPGFGTQQQALPFNMPGMVPPPMTMPMMSIPMPPPRLGK